MRQTDEQKMRVMDSWRKTIKRQLKKNPKTKIPKEFKKYAPPQKWDSGYKKNFV